jgi:hypothetical protein
MDIMDEKQRLQLQNMIKSNDVVDQTQLIRDLKHSHILKNEINNMIMIKAMYRDDPEKINLECMNECNFLFTYYTNIYNKIKKDEIDISILNKFIDVLRQIEDGELDQHTGSFLVGTILKELYVDSAIKKADKLNEEHDKNVPVKEVKEPVKISWKQFKSSFYNEVRKG